MKTDFAFAHRVPRQFTYVPKALDESNQSVKTETRYTMPKVVKDVLQVLKLA